MMRRDTLETMGVPAGASFRPVPGIVARPGRSSDVCGVRLANRSTREAWHSDCLHELACASLEGTEGRLFVIISGRERLQDFGGHAIVGEPHERRWADRVLILLTVVLFSVSGGLLWHFGYNYDGLTGPAYEKIHPTTYLALLALVVLVVPYRNPVTRFWGLLADNPGASVFLLVSIVLGLFIVLDGRRGIATVFDTYIVAVVCILLINEADERTKRSLETILHVLMAANAVLALTEMALDFRISPYRLDDIQFETDRRSTALLGHPLTNATAAATYMIMLVSGGGSALRPWSRSCAALLQLASLVAFGGRSALTTSLALLAILAVTRLLQIFNGRRFTYAAAASVAVMVPALLMAVGVLASSGFFDLFMERMFGDDGGSAQARVGMLNMLRDLPWSTLLLGGDQGLIDSLRFSEGLEWGIENPVVRLILYQGAILTALVVIGFALLMLDIARRTGPGTMLPFLSFLVIITSFESIANKSQILARFVVLMLILFPRTSDISESPDQGGGLRARSS